MTRPLARTLAVLAALLAFTAPAIAQVVNVAKWDGGTDPLSLVWSNPINWDDDLTGPLDSNPFFFQHIEFNSNLKTTNTMDITRTIHEMRFTAGTTTAQNITGSGANRITLLGVDDVGANGRGLHFQATSAAHVLNFNLGLGANTFFRNDSANTITVGGANGNINGAFGFTKVGTGTIILNGNNTYTGVTTITTGTLQIGNGGTTGSLGTGNTTNNTALVFNRSDAVGSYAGIISGTGTVTKQGSGTYTLSGNNTYSGVTTISTGTLQIGNGGTTGSLGTGNTTNNAALVFSRSDAAGSYAGIISGTGTVTQNGIGTTTLSGANTYSGTTTVSQGTLRAGAANTFSTTSAVTLANVSGATLALNDFAQTVPSLSGGGANGGNVTLGSATLTVNGTTNTTYAGVISGTGGLTKSNTNSFILTGNNTYTGGTAVNGGTLELGGGTGSGSIDGAIAMGSGSTLLYNRSDNYSTANTWTGSAGSVRKTGTNMLTLTGTGSTYTGIWDIENGVVAISDATSLGGAGLVLEIAGSGGSSPELQLSNNIALTVLTLDTSGATALRNASGNNSITASSSVQLNGGSGPSTWISDADTLTINGNVSAIAPNLSLTLAGAGNGVVANAISNGSTDNLPLTKTGAGTWTLSGANTYTGATTITGGILRVNGSLASGSAVTVQGGTLAGTGTVNGTVAVTNTGRLAPGNSIGELTVGSTSWTGGGTFELEYQSASADPTTPGTTHDHLKGTTSSSLDLSGVTSENKFNLELTFVQTGDPTGLLATYVFATFDSITGATPGDVTDLFNVSGQFAGPVFVTLTDGSSDTLSITFNPVPEPTTVLGLAFAALATGRLVRRRRTS